MSQQLPTHIVRPMQTAKAPYNFVPLPENVLEVAPESLPDHNRISGHSGHFLVRLTTQSPLYIRGLLEERDFHNQQAERDIKGKPTFRMDGGKKVPIDVPFRDVVRNKPDFFNVMGEQQPLIPGSSLRGMIRTLYEIVTYSKVQPVSNAEKMFFRVVADNSDPLGKKYKRLLGNNASNVSVGYLERNGGQWFIRPARSAGEIDSRLRNDPFIKVRKDAIKNGSIQIEINGFMGLDTPGNRYRPQYYNVHFDVGRIEYWTEPKKNKPSEKRTPDSANVISERNRSLPYQGTLVATGNMLETNDGKSDSLRMNMYLIPEPSARALIPIRTQAIDDYLAALTPFQTKPPFDSENGFLKHGRPVFYLPAKHGEVQHFGHTPNFRVAHVKNFANVLRATTPADFVPNRLKDEAKIDFAEAVFGFIRSKEFRDKQELKQGNKRAGYASRVFVTDAQMLDGQRNIYFVQNGNHTIVPKILASPKPTAFQLYLTQQDEQKSRLKHYGSKSPQETVIRGHKLYWHKGAVEQKDIEPVPNSPNMQGDGLDVHSTQHTQIKPLRPDLTFEFKVYFNNLSKSELGALAWVLKLPANHCHKIGMGKGLGLGSVLLHDIELHVDNCQQRYECLFSGKTWGQPTLDKSIEEYKQVFESYVLNSPIVDATSYLKLSRIEALLRMLHWWKRDDSWLETIRYMEIEHPQNGDEYAARTILPTPQDVVTTSKPVLGKLQHPSSQRFEKREGTPATGTVEFFRKTAGQILVDDKDIVIRVHRRDLKVSKDKLSKGVRVKFKIGEKDGKLFAFDVELLT